MHLTLEVLLKKKKKYLLHIAANLGNFNKLALSPKF